MSDPHGEDIMELNETLSAQRALITELQGDIGQLREEVRQLREENAELRAEIQRQAAELDGLYQRKVVLTTAGNMMSAMESCRDDEPGTVLRATDQSGLEYKLGEDKQWTRAK